MIEIRAVVIADYVVPFHHWAVDKETGSIALSGRLSPAGVGSAMAAIVMYTQRDDSAPDADTLLRSFVQRPGPAWGGLEVRDTDTGVTIGPSCCCGLGDWRDWLGVPNGERPWLGHDPDPTIVIGDGVARLRADSGHGPVIDIPLDVLPSRLQTVHQELIDFLALVREQFGAEVAEVLDQRFAIRAPLAA